MSVCNVGALWPNGWMDQDATEYEMGTTAPTHTFRPTVELLLVSFTVLPCRPKYNYMLWIISQCFSERELTFTFVVCQSSVTLVHLTQPVEISRNVSTPFGTLAIR